MLRATAAIAASMLLMGNAGAPQRPILTDAPGPGVPLTLAETRATEISDLRYDLSFVLPGDGTAGLQGAVTIRFNLKDASLPLYLDFSARQGAVTGGTINGRAAVPEYLVDHLAIYPADLRAGANEVTLQFSNAGSALNMNPEFMYALFVPARAREVFPCFDQPDLKARYTLALDVPASWEAITNGAEVARDERPGRRHLRFAETAPIPTYLFTFAAGQFKVETAQRAGRAFRMLHRETDAEKVARNRDAIFDLHAGALQWLETYTGIPYPFGKFEFLLVPSFQFGGMEHPGSIYYNASALLLDPSATQNQKLGRASLIAHETAHMWFGDLVTMRWFNDVWMKEVFANFMAAKIVNPAFPEINHELRFLYSHYPAAYGVDRTAGTNAIRQPLLNLNEAGSLYGAIIYQKAPIVMRQLEAILGAEVLRGGLQEYLKQHAFGNATWADLITILDTRTPRDLAAWSRAWVEEAGRPQITTALQITNDRIERLAFAQRDPVAARGLTWSQGLKVTLGYSDSTRTLDAELEGRTAIVKEASGLPAPLYVLPTGAGVGYGGFVLDARSRRWLLANLASIPEPLTRGAALVTLWEEMLDGRVRASELAPLLLTAVAREKDELNVERMLGYTGALYWRFLDEPARAALAPRLDATLKSGLATAGTQSLKSAWFNAVRDTAQDPKTLAWLEAIWRKAEDVPGLVLAEPDFITLAQELAVRGVPNADAILDAQIARTENPDRKARMIFVRPALSAALATRDAFFKSLAERKNRAREAWVLEALGYLHHPLRAAAAEKYVLPSLTLLREIQQTGDIFFPKRWMDATLSGHRSPQVARMVRQFVARLDDTYPDRLRRIILSSADDLFRISRMPR
jgi:aminopeptidase N